MDVGAFIILSLKSLVMVNYGNFNKSLQSDYPFGIFLTLSKNSVTKKVPLNTEMPKPKLGH